MSEGLFPAVVSLISRVLFCRDALTGRRRRLREGFCFEAERVTIASGPRRLAAVHVVAGAEAPVVLICHGIGERVEYWAEAQRVLCGLGCSSLVFDYSGYGASTGRIRALHCEEDAVAAHRYLVAKGARSIFLLGFSLGTGVAASVVRGLAVDGMILCEGFSSLRAAARAVGLPRGLVRCGPDLWQVVRAVAEVEVPVLVLHSTGDELFPVVMAEQVVAACGRMGELVVVEGLAHNAPIFAPNEVYWGPVARWVRERGGVGG